MSISSLPSETIFEMGYAVPVFSVLKEYRSWRYRNEYFRTRADAVVPIEIGGWFAAPLSDVCGNAVAMEEIKTAYKEGVAFLG